MKKFKTPAVIITAIAVITAAFVTSQVFAAFSDMPANHWASAAVTAMSEKGIIAGYPDGEFKPSGTVTYGEFIKMAYIAATGEDPGGTGANWALPYYEASVEAVFFGGDIREEALPYPISREYMAVILSGIVGKVEIADYENLRENLIDVDWNAPHEYDIMKVYSMGLITGYPDSTFRPDGTLTRAEAATVIYRLIEKGVRVEPVVKEQEEEPEVGSLEERMEHVDGDGIGRILMADKAVPEGNLSDIVDGIEKFAVDDTDPLYGVTKYEIIKDYNYKMEVVKNLAGGTGIDIKININYARAFMIKGRTLTELAIGKTQIGVKHFPGDTRYDQDISTDFDYIGFVAYPSDCMILILNSRTLLGLH